MSLADKKIKAQKAREEGFTFIELIMVITMIGILASVALQKMITTAERTELIAEDMTIDTMRSNIVSNFGADLLQGKPAQFPVNPFDNLSKVPRGYDRERNRRPSGTKPDNDIWIFNNDTGTTGQFTTKETGTTIEEFSITGFIFHQRKDGTVAKWPYDFNSGIIGKKIIETESELNKELDRIAKERGEITEEEVIQKTN
ncbi:MAG: type II secretion system protein [Candidatus Nitrohelix vancouverensis]|uniref:Type II secretion system protein n=1 Tax=Candidatus Nitrohelix vancouverensis TaxID=2705534 RepID=A0A7T0C1L7_9BACT|nr:MAG: type II secretion system protein [Candidatus Nitrohelix vancouverensis]